MKRKDYDPSSYYVWNGRIQANPSFSSSGDGVSSPLLGRKSARNALRHRQQHAKRMHWSIAGLLTMAMVLVLYSIISPEPSPQYQEQKQNLFGRGNQQVGGDTSPNLYHAGNTNGLVRVVLEPIDGTKNKVDGAGRVDARAIQLPASGSIRAPVASGGRRRGGLDRVPKEKVAAFENPHRLPLLRQNIPLENTTLVSDINATVSGDSANDTTVSQQRFLLTRSREDGYVSYSTKTRSSSSFSGIIGYFGLVVVLLGIGAAARRHDIVGSVVSWDWSGQKFHDWVIEVASSEDNDNGSATTAEEDDEDEYGCYDGKITSSRSPREIGYGSFGGFARYTTRSGSVIGSDAASSTWTGDYFDKFDV